MGIDTVTLCGNSELPGQEAELNGDQLEGPVDAAAAASQIHWLKETLANASDADYIIVGGHYPMYSICEHGPTPCITDSVKPLLDEAGASIYINGHDHCAEHIAKAPPPACQYHTIGSAHLNDPSEA